MNCEKMENENLDLIEKNTKLKVFKIRKIEE